MKRKFAILVCISVTVFAAAQTGDDVSTVDSLYHAKDYVEAVKTAKALLERQGDMESKGEVYSMMASLYAQAGNLTQAEDYIKRALDYLMGSSRFKAVAVAYGRASDIYHRRGNYNLSLEYAEKGVKAAMDSHDDDVLAELRLQRSYPHISKGCIPQAVSDLQFADSTFRAKGNESLLAEVRYQIGQLYDNPSQIQVAISNYRDAVTMARNTSNLPLLQKACRRLGFALHETEPREAYNYMKEAADVQEMIIQEVAAGEIALFTVEYSNLQKDVIITQKERQLKAIAKRFFVTLALSILFILLILQLRYMVKQQRKRAEELTKLDEQKNLLFSIIAHDLRSPAIAQQAALNILSKNIDSYSKDEIATIIKDMSMQAKSEVALIENILRWSRTKTKKGELQLARFNVSDAISELVDEFKQSALQKELNISTHMNDESITLRSERGFIMLVLRNIISNAIKFTPRGGHIDISAREEADGASIMVKDDGIGMNEETLNQLFLLQSIVSRKGTDGEMGTGFGLVVSNDLIHEIGGSIKAESEEGKGSTFVITIPNITNHERKG